MQDLFIGDIGDFANNGLLRALCGTPDNPVPGLKLGVVEYYNNPKGPKKQEGNKIGYLKSSEYNNRTYRECDQSLYEALQKMMGESLVSGIELKLEQDMAKKLLPVDERYYDALLPSGDRTDWLQNAIQKVGDANLVFVNPDTGIASDQEKNPKPTHLRIDELSYFFEEHKSLVIYQQIGQGLERGQTAENFIEQTAGRLKHQLPSASKFWAFRWRRFSGRVYFIVARTEEHKDTIEKQLEAFRNSPWMTKEHFTEQSI